MKTPKKLGFKLAIALAILIGIYALGQITGILKIMQTGGTNANKPALVANQYFVSSTLVKPKLHDFVCFYYTDPNLGKMLRVYRLCAQPGDEVEVRKGNLYVNGRSADDSLNLCLYYTIPAVNAAGVIETLKLEEEDAMITDSGTAIVSLTTKQVKQLTAQRITCERYAFNQPVAEIEQKFHQPWTMDNFGPVKVPADHYFLLGDNRYSAQDSRFIGFIARDSIYSVVLGHH